MRLALVSSEDSALDIHKEVRAALEKEIINVEVVEQKLPQVLDIPVWVGENPGYDLYFVFVVYRRPRVEHKVLLEKLVSLEMDGKARILKAVSKLDDEWDRDELAQKWVKKILRQLFPGEAEPVAGEAGEEDEEEEEAGQGFKFI
ncbi:MAG: hypothetical protein J4203_07680 [Candidatus Diapherotrites archaeon]|uniref:Uncharacterized protein n=2 Tax=Candidatus Iainarchaeum sp. TaxID=3101447 RepID=A0A8T4LLR2_9ARCH|nr:hypothetical protein [Candidatus Diapherotrites archaeon]